MRGRLITIAAAALAGGAVRPVRPNPAGATSRPAGMRPVAVSRDGRGFVLAGTDEPFVPWGFNYDHDRSGRLLEDYWTAEWPTVEADFREMKALGANVVRVHLQVGRFLASPDRADRAALERLGRLVALAERTGLRLDITGLGCYHARDVPAWYDRLPEAGRWRAQGVFWEAVARTCAGRAAVFCYDLMNEPILPGRGRKETDWLAGEFGGKHFVQRIALDLAGRSRQDVAEAWVAALVGAIRRRDRRTPVTVGVIPWAMVFPGARPVFYSRRVGRHLDFASVHVYPERGKVPQALRALAAYDIGKPVVVEETFPLRCTPKQLEAFLVGSRGIAAGWMGFYWGATPDELAGSKTIADALTRRWLELFVRLNPDRRRGAQRRR